MKFRRQHPIGPYVADFACVDAKLIVELDGGQHGLEPQADADAIRTVYLEGLGWTILRFWNNDALANTDGVLETIRLEIKARYR